MSTPSFASARVRMWPPAARGPSHSSRASTSTAGTPAARSAASLSGSTACVTRTSMASAGRPPARISTSARRAPTAPSCSAVSPSPPTSSGDGRRHSGQRATTRTRLCPAIASCTSSRSRSLASWWSAVSGAVRGQVDPGRCAKCAARRRPRCGTSSSPQPRQLNGARERRSLAASRSARIFWPCRSRAQARRTPARPLGAAGTACLLLGRRRTMRLYCPQRDLHIRAGAG